MNTWITVGIIIIVGVSLIAYLFQLKPETDKLNPNHKTTPDLNTSVIDKIKNLEVSELGLLYKKEWFFPLLLALGVVWAVWFMADGLPWWSFFTDNRSGAWVLLAALIVATIVYKKKAVPYLGILLLLSLGFYFGPKVTEAREGPKSAAQVGFFDGEVPLKAGVWSKTIFVKGGFDHKGPPNVPYTIKINGIKEIKCDGKGNILIPVNEGIVRSIQFNYPIDTMITFTQLTK